MDSIPPPPKRISKNRANTLEWRRRNFRSGGRSFYWTIVLSNMGLAIINEHQWNLWHWKRHGMRMLCWTGVAASNVPNAKPYCQAYQPNNEFKSDPVSVLLLIEMFSFTTFGTLLAFVASKWKIKRNQKSPVIYGWPNVRCEFLMLLLLNYGIKFEHKEVDYTDCVISRLPSRRSCHFPSDRASVREGTT